MDTTGYMIMLSYTFVLFIIAIIAYFVIKNIGIKKIRNKAF